MRNKMTKEEFLGRYRKDQEKKKLKECRKQYDYYAVKEAGYRRSRFKIGEM